MDVKVVAATLLLSATVAFALFDKPAPALVTAIAGVAYFSMVESRDAIAARYADWILTTPIILFLLLRKTLSAPWVAFVCGADALMIATGYLGATQASVEDRRAWFALSCAFFVPVILALVYAIRSSRFGAGVARAAFVLVVWLAYPVVWWAQYCLRGESIGPERASEITAALDVVAKIGFGVLI